MSINKPTIQKHYSKVETEKYRYELELTIYKYMIEKLTDRLDVL